VNDEAERVVRELELAPHPEGGYYREIFRSPNRVVDARGRTRSALTVIYFLLSEGDVSAWHRLGSDETWHFARGGELEISVLDGDGGIGARRIGCEGPYAAIVPAGRAFAARVVSGAYALVSCCVAPGFEFDEFELLDAERLARTYPASAAAIRAFVR
jgi:predicted cupin superfamily sugar epimerase